MIQIEYIQFYEHPIFGNQKFDFTFDGVNIANNIVIAGENGSGKTTLLEEIRKTINSYFSIGNSLYSAKKLEISIRLLESKYYEEGEKREVVTSAILTISHDARGNFANNIKFFCGDREVTIIRDAETNERVYEFKISSLYSGVDINYKPRYKVEGVTNTTLDSDENVESDDFARDIIQLLVNINTQDANDLQKWQKSHIGVAPSEEMINPRINRFSNAFKLIFNDTLVFSEVKNNSIPIFLKGNKEIEISSLSSGEKQIIFRGAYLLRNINSLRGMPVLIDEPEISMHPKWEKSIFDYYRKIFFSEAKQTSQIFFATHSEHVLTNALNEPDCLVIKLTDSGYEKIYKGSTGTILPTVTIAETKYTIFNMYTIDFHILLYGYIQENLVTDNSGNIMQANVEQTDKWLKSKGVTLKPYRKQLQNRMCSYDTLPTYIRNCIDHPDANITYQDQDLITSIEEMINIIKSAI